jgi:2',3'-cyclic-nucleotide 2'-phosphodiesterase (5'-nucleotidase family)
MSKRTILAVVLVMAICLALRHVACTGKPPEGSGKVAPDSKVKVAGDSAAASAPTSAKPLFDGWEKPAVAILLSGEMHGYIEPCGCSLHQLGGLSRRADLLRQIAERGWPVTALDVGGLVNNPTRRQGKFKCDMVLKCLTDMRYGGVAVGVEDLQLGLDFINFQKPDELPLLSANIIFFGERDFPGGPVPGKTIEAGGVKIGVTAAFDPELEDLVRPG